MLFHHLESQEKFVGMDYFETCIVSCPQTIKIPPLVCTNDVVRSLLSIMDVDKDSDETGLYISAFYTTDS